MKFMMLVLTLFALTAAPSTVAAEGEGVFGVWLTESGLSKLEIFPCGDRACGRVIWIKHPTYQNSKDGPVGSTKVDRHNPDPSLRNRPILGLQVMEGLTRDGELWKGGACYDPQTGKLYQCKMRLESPTELKVRGFVGISLFGRSYTLTRDLSGPADTGHSANGTGNAP